MALDSKLDSNHDIPSFDPNYHRRQWDTCYESTKAFLDFLATHNVLDRESTATVIDMCCGSGANLFWAKERFPGVELVGVDAVPELVDFGNRELAEHGVVGASLLYGDAYALEDCALPKPDGVIAVQTISWMPDEVGFIESVCKLDPDWIALTGLLIPGPRSFRCQINNDDAPQAGINYYNTFSIPYLERLFEERGYGDFRCDPFIIGIDLEKPVDVGSRTYTEKTEDGRRLQISGAILMNWWFMLARRKN